MATRQALGKGLGALIPDAKGPARTGVIQAPINDLHPNPHQPRKAMNSQGLKDLMITIQEKGVLQPILVRTREGGGYEIVAGERRYRAAKALGLHSIPAILRETTDQERLELALIENIQREDLTPFEKAQSYQQLLAIQHITQEELATRVGKDRVSIANTLRLLKLPQDLHPHLQSGKLNLAHALVVLSLPDQDQQRRLGTKIVQEELTVKAAEELAKSWQAAAKPRRRSFLKPPANVHLKKTEADLARRLGTKVKIQGSNKRGRIVIEYYSLADLDRITHRLI